MVNPKRAYRVMAQAKLLLPKAPRRPQSSRKHEGTDLHGGLLQEAQLSRDGVVELVADHTTRMPRTLLIGRLQRLTPTWPG